MKLFEAVVIILVLLGTVHGALASDVNVCQIIALPGEYTMVADFSGSVGNVYGSGCIIIAAANVTLDCQGHTLSAVGSDAAVFISPPSTEGVIVENCVLLANTSNAALAGYNPAANGLVVQNTTINGYGGPGISFIGAGAGTADVTITQSTVYNCSVGINGPNGRSFANGTITNNIFYGNTWEMNGVGATFTNNLIARNIFNGTGEGKNRINESAFSGNANTWTDGSGGNRWTNPDGVSGYTDYCTDANMDEVCDSAYILYTENTDQLPLKNIDAISGLGAVTCEASNGCLFWETFSYSDALTQHGWAGTWPWGPTDNAVSQHEYQCVAAGVTSPAIWHLLNGTASSATGTFTVDFRARLCADPNAGLTVWLGNDQYAGLKLRFWADTGTGLSKIEDGHYETVADSIGATANDPGNLTCSVDNQTFTLYDNRYTITAYPQNTPMTYDLAVNGVPVAYNHEWDDQTSDVVGFVYFGGTAYGRRCWWFIDDILVQNSQLVNVTGPETSIQTIGAFSSEGFDWTRCGCPTSDRESCPSTVKNRAACAAGVAFGDSLRWLGRLILSHLFETFILLIILVVLALLYWRNK